MKLAEKGVCEAVSGRPTGRNGRRSFRCAVVRRAAAPAIEVLEIRTLMSTVASPLALQPSPADLATLQSKIAAIAALHLPASAQATPALSIYHGANVNQTSAPNPAGITPTQIRNYYGINSVSFNGIAGDGRGQTIAIVDAFDDPTIAKDLATFDAVYHLPAPPSFTKMSQTGSKTQLPSAPVADPTQGSWAAEISLDVEWAHVIAPQANILLIETADDSMANLLAGAGYAATVPSVSIVSMSFGDPESNLSAADVRAFDAMLTVPAGHQGVTFFASTGDSGAFADGFDLGVAYPSSSPDVIAVGGTSFTENSAGTLAGETAWSGSGGGTSIFEPQSAAQKNAIGIATGRQSPDIAFDADPNTGVNLCDSFDFGSSTPFAVFGGTSLSAPSWTAMTSIVNQGLIAAGSPVLSGTTALASLLYSRPAADFNDITSGDNGNFTAGPGYDLVTGLGSPVANKLIPDLAKAGITPFVQSLTSAPTSEPSATSFVLTASKVIDAAAPITGVNFYRETNKAVGLQALSAQGGTAGDLLLGAGVSDGHGNWKVTVNTIGLPNGPVTYYAIATDSRGITGIPTTAVNTIASAKSPVIHSLTTTPTSENEGTSFTLAANQVSETGGTISRVDFYRETNHIPGFQGGAGGDTRVASDTSAANGWSTTLNTAGLDPGLYTWYAVAYDSAGVGSASASTTNTVNALKIIGALAAGPSTEAAGTSFTLTASKVAETGRTITQVQFYREANSAAGPQPASGLDTLLGTGVNRGAGNWTFSVNTSALTPGSYHYYAVARDSAGLRSSAVAATNTISDTHPVVGAFTVNPSSSPAGTSITLTASNLSSPDVGGAITGVSFYRESNGNSGLQTGSDGDLLIGSASKNASGNWTLSANTDSLFTGSYLYYAVVTDNYGGSTVASARHTIIPPPNDNFAQAQLITGVLATIPGTNENATVEPGEPHHAGNAGGASVWYVWTAPSNGQVNINVNDSAFTSLLAVYVGKTLKTLSSITSSDANTSATAQASVSFKAVAGTRYYIAVDGHNYEDGTGPGEGAFTLNFSMPGLINKPANDNFAKAQVLSGTSITISGSNINATRETGEPLHAGNDGGASVWYAWTAASTGTVSLNTHGSTFDTLLAVYTGSSLTQLTTIAANDDTSPTDSTSQLTFKALAGTTYKFVVDGFNPDAGAGTGPAEGAVMLHLTETASAAVVKSVFSERAIA